MLINSHFDRVFDFKFESIKIWTTLNNFILLNYENRLILDRICVSQICSNQFLFS